MACRAHSEAQRLFSCPQGSTLGPGHLACTVEPPSNRQRGYAVTECCINGRALCRSCVLRDLHLATSLWPAQQHLCRFAVHHRPVC